MAGLGRSFVSAAVGRANNFLSGGYRGPKSHALGAGRNVESGAPTSKHSTRWLRGKYSCERLQFPFNVESDPHQGHYIVFDIKKYKPAKLEGLRAKQKTLQKALNNVRKELSNPDRGRFRTAQGTISEVKGREANVQNQLIENTNKINDLIVAGEGGPSSQGRGVKANSAIALTRNQTKSSLGSIALYMPPSVTTQYKVNYGNPEIALHTELGMKAFEAFMSDQGGLVSGLTAALDASKGGLKELAKKGSLGFVEKIAPGARVLGQMATGQVITPRMELMFESVGRRSFTYTFIFIPKSLREAEEVEKIVYQFKHAMHPKFLSGGNNIRTMEIPDTFEISYMTHNRQNAFLNKISSCFLQSMDVQYGADRFTAYPEAKNLFLAGPGRTGSPPQRTQITLNFTELAILTQQDIEEGY